MWINADYSWNDGSYHNSPAHGDNAFGIAAAGRYALTDKLGAAMRVEYVRDECCFFGFPGAVQIWSVTGTVDYALTEQLTVKGEIRFDTGSVHNADDDLFISDQGQGAVLEDKAQTLVGVEAIYRF